MCAGSLRIRRRVYGSYTLLRLLEELVYGSNFVVHSVRIRLYAITESISETMINIAWHPNS